MPILIEWENDEKRLIYWKFQGRVTAQELRQTIQTSNALINAQEHKVDHIIDFSQAEGIPPNTINEARYAVRQMPKNLGRAVIISGSGFIAVVGETLQHFSWFSQKVHVVRSDAEAHAYLESLRARTP